MAPTPYSDLLASVQRRAANNRLFAARRRVKTVVIVDGTRYQLHLRDVPVVGTLLDVGYTVAVTSSKRLAGGSAIVYARRVVNP